MSPRAIWFARGAGDYRFDMIPAEPDYVTLLGPQHEPPVPNRTNR